MKFGKLADVDGIQFQLPPDPEETSTYLERLSSPSVKNPMEVYLGATGWSMKEWVGTVYPKGTKTTNYLAAYGRQFNSIELNTTHYRVPPLEQIKRWQQQVPPDFRFCPKIPQTISHSRTLGIDSTTFTLFVDHIAGLENQLGCCFMQLPPYFDLERWPILEQFLSRWPTREIPLTIELRHPSWFNYTDQIKPCFDLLERQNVGLVITDVAGRRDVLHMRITAPFTLVRFVGNGLHPTDYQRAADWIGRLTHWAQQGLQEVFFFPHQPDNLKAPTMIAHFTEQLSTIPGIHTRGPNLYPSDNQISLFS